MKAGKLNDFWYGSCTALRSDRVIFFKTSMSGRLYNSRHPRQACMISLRNVCIRSLKLNIYLCKNHAIFVMLKLIVFPLNHCHNFFVFYVRVKFFDCTFFIKSCNNSHNSTLKFVNFEPKYSGIFVIGMNYIFLNLLTSSGNDLLFSTVFQGL